jgi:hypothetical protein
MATVSRKGKVFFSEEKKQNTIVRWVYARRATYAKLKKFFGSFFQKRTTFPILSHHLFA